MNQTPRVSWPLRHRGRLACTRSLERRTAGCVLFVTCYLLLRTTCRVKMHQSFSPWIRTKLPLDVRSIGRTASTTEGGRPPTMCGHTQSPQPSPTGWSPTRSACSSRTKMPQRRSAVRGGRSRQPTMDGMAARGGWSVDEGRYNMCVVGAVRPHTHTCESSWKPRKTRNKDRP